MAETELQIVARMRDRMSPALRRLQQGFARLTRGVGGVIKRLTSFRTALVGSLAGGALIAGTKAIAENGRELDQWSRKLGTSTEELSALAAGVELAGFDFDFLREGLKTLQERMDDAGRGNATYQESFARLGVDVRDADGNLRNVVDILPEVAAGFQRVAASGGAQDLVLITEDLIGGTENLLSVLLQEGPEKLEEVVATARRFGLDLSSTFTFRASRFATEMSLVQQQFLAIAQQAFESLEPYLTAALRQFNEWLRGFRDGTITMEAFENTVDSVFKFVVGSLASALAGLLTFIGRVLGAAESLANGVAQTIAGIGTVLVSTFRLALVLLADQLHGFFEELSKAGRAAQFVLSRFEKLLGGSGGLTNGLFGAGRNGIEQALSAVGGLAEGLQLIETQIATFQTTKFDFFAKDVLNAASAVEDFEKQVIEQGIAVLEQIPIFAGFAAQVRKLRDENEKLTGRGGGGGSDSTPNGRFFNSFTEQIRLAQSAWRDFAQAGIAAATSIASTIENGLVDAISSAILGLQSWRDAFEAFGQLVVQELVRIIVRLVVVQALASAVDLAFGASTYFGLSSGLTNASSGGSGSGSSVGAQPGAVAEGLSGRPDVGLAELRGSRQAAASRGTTVVNVTVNNPVQSTASGTEVAAAMIEAKETIGAVLEEVVLTTTAGRRAVGRRFG